MEKDTMSITDGATLTAEHQKLQVLFVGNDPYNQLYDLQEEVDFRSATITEALQKISEEQVTCDAVVVDATIDVIQIKMLRRTTIDKNLPLIFYTSFFDQKMKERALKLNADDYVTGSTRYSFGNRIKLVKQMRKFKIQWLQQDKELKIKRNEMWQFLDQRLPDIILSFVTLILLFPGLVIIVAIVREIESMERHIFTEGGNKHLLDRINNWYQFTVLILFSPIFAIVKLPLQLFRGRELFFHENENQSDRFDKIIKEKACTGFLHLFSVLTGNTSFFRDKHLQRRANQFDKMKLLSRSI